MGVSSKSAALCLQSTGLRKSTETTGKRKWNECSEAASMHHVPESMKRICVRAQRNFQGWWRKCNSDQILGQLAEPMQALAKQMMQTIDPGQRSSLRVLSLADGSMWSDCTVPTSVLLAHSFATLGIHELPFGVKRVVIFGADSGNTRSKPQGKLPSLPKWIELNSLELNNQEDITSQLAAQFETPPKFDAVVMRQGLCFCEDLSWESLPPETLEFIGLPSAIAGCNCCGGFVLQPSLFNGRPFYRRGEFLLFWRPNENYCCSCCPAGDWVVVGDHGSGDVYAYVRNDVGNPSVAREPWYVWDQKTCEYKVHYAVSCKLTAKPPWSRPANLRQCCAGIPLNAGKLLAFMQNVAMVLDETAPRAFALLHGGMYAGTRPEVKELHAELEEAVDSFNSGRWNVTEFTKNNIVATTLKKEKGEKVHYWEVFDGLLLSRKFPS